MSSQVMCSCLSLLLHGLTAALHRLSMASGARHRSLRLAAAVTLTVVHRINAYAHLP